jgi:hypothetical protein
MNPRFPLKEFGLITAEDVKAKRNATLYNGI